MRTGWRWVLGILGTLVVAVTLVVAFFDWNWLRGPLESKLSSLTGKQVKIEGPIQGEWAWVPHIVVKQINIQDPTWTPDPKVAQIDDLAFSIDLRRLLRGGLDFPEIVLGRPVLNLERSAKGKANWDIANEASGPSNRANFPVIGNLKIENGKISYRDPAKKVSIDAIIDTVAANGGSGEGSVTLDGKGTYRNVPFTLKMKGGSLNALRDTNEPWDIDVRASVGNTEVAAAGTLTDPFKMTDIDVKLTAQGDNADELYTNFGIPAPSTPPYKLTGQLDRDGKRWLFKNFSGTVGNSDLAGTLRFEPERQRMFVTGDLTSKSLDFSDLGLLVGGPGSTSGDRPVSEQQKQVAREMEQDNRVLPDAPLRVQEVRNVDTDLTFKGEKIQAKDLPLDNTDFHLKIDNGVLTLDPLRVGVADGHIDAAIVLNARQDPVVTDYDVKFHGFEIKRFLERAGFPQGATGSLDGRIRIRGIGNSVRRSLARSDGEMSAIVDNGTISALASDILGLDVAKALGVYISGDDKPFALRCMIADFQVDNGVMKARTLVLDSGASVVTGEGTVDLRNEHLDLSLTGKPKQPTLIHLGGPIQIGGMLGKPDVGLGAETAVRSGAAVALGAILTPLASILGFVDPGSGKNADCLALEKEAEANSAQPPPATVARQPLKPKAPTGNGSSSPAPVR